MKVLLDTQMLLWAANEPKRLPDKARPIINSLENELLFSPASLWEIVIKNSLGRKDFKVDARVLRRGLLDNGYTELSITSEHAITLEGLPPGHKDPFDRMLVAQALAEGVMLISTDHQLKGYPGLIRVF